MTAFGRGGGGLVAWEIKSVNHRYLELGFRLPEPLRDLEPTLREVTMKRLARGKVDATLRLGDGCAPPSRVHAEGLRSLVEAVAELRRQVPDATVDALEALRWPGVLTVDEQALAGWREAAVAGYGAALDDLLAQRRREGASIRDVLETKLGEILAFSSMLRNLAAANAPRLRERLHAKVRDLPLRLDAGRLEQEAALLAQRADVTEELDRLDVHVGAACECVAGDAPCGRRLDFLTQELGREANTIAAKTPLPQAATLAVKLKTAVEQLREQAQNVE